MMAPVLKPGSGIEALTNRRDFLRNLGVGAAALGVHSSVGRLFADEPPVEKAAEPEEPKELLPKFIRECPNEKERKALEFAWSFVRISMQCTSVTENEFDGRFHSHSEPPEDEEFVQYLRTNILEGTPDADGKLAGPYRIKTPRVYGSMSCKNGDLIVSVGVIQNEVRAIETSPTKVLRQKKMESEYHGLGPLTCSIMNAQDECVRSFPVRNNGTGITSLKGIPFPFTIKFTVEAEEKKEEETSPKNHIQFFGGGDYAIA